MRVLVYILSSLEGSENANTCDGLSHGSWVTNWQLLFRVFGAIKARTFREEAYLSNPNHVRCTFSTPCLTAPMRLAGLQSSLYIATQWPPKG